MAQRQPGQRGLSLGRWFGVHIQVDWSLSIIFLLVLVSLGAGLLPSWHANWSPTLIWSVAMLAAVLFFLSVLVHEMSHALVGRAFGIPMRRITLYLFGGAAHMDEEPPSAISEFVMAIVGPITSAVIGVGCLWGAAMFPSTDLAATDPAAMVAAMGPSATILAWLGSVNLILAAFNMLPGFPLDGGRVLRAILRGITGDLVKATRWAASVGQLVGAIFIGIGVAMALGVHIPFFGTGLIGGIWIAMIGWFLRRAAMASYQQLIVSRVLHGVHVDDLVSRHPDTVDPDEDLDSVVREHLLGTTHRSLPIVDHGELIGALRLEDVQRIRRDAWPFKRARELAIPLTELAVVSADAPAEEALRRLLSGDAEELLVTDHGQFRGLLRRSDVLRWMELHANTETDKAA